MLYIYLLIYDNSSIFSVAFILFDTDSDEYYSYEDEDVKRLYISVMT